MAVSLTFNNDTKFELILSRFSPNIASSVEIEQSLANALPSFASTNFTTSDPQFFGTGDETIIIVWKEPSTGTQFGFRVDYPMSIAGVHLGDYKWGYFVSPAPIGSEEDWVIRSAPSVNDIALATPVTIHKINSQFLYAIQPKLTADLMTFAISMGSEK